MASSDREDGACGGSARLFEAGEIVTVKIGPAWVWGVIEAVTERSVTFEAIRVTDTLSVPPQRGGRTASAGKTTIMLDSVEIIVRGVLQEWE